MVPVELFSTITSAHPTRRSRTSAASGCFRSRPRQRFVRLEEAKEGVISLPRKILMKSG